VVDRPDPEEVEQHLCLDTGFDNPTGHAAVGELGYINHIQPIGEDRRAKRRPGRRKARRWVVERTLACLSKCRALLVSGPGSFHDACRSGALVSQVPPAHGRMTV
jgi:putative transposase